MDLDDLRYVGRRPVNADDDVALRMRFALGGQTIDAIVPQAAANVWFRRTPAATTIWRPGRGRSARRRSASASAGARSTSATW